MSDEAVPVVIIQGHECLGCGKPNTICLEVGVQGGYQTLACRSCIDLIFERAEIAVENKTTNESEVIEVPEEELVENTSIRVEVDVNDTNI